MKKARKILCALLAVVLVFALTIPALADESEISTCGTQTNCPKCGRSGCTVRTTTSIDSVIVNTPNGEHCSHVPGVHEHQVNYTYNYYTCPSCGSFTTKSVWTNCLG